MRSWGTLIIWLVAALILRAEPDNKPRPGSAAVSSSLEPAEVLSHLGRTISWFHRVQAFEPDAGVSEDLVARDRLRETSTAALQLSFDFARAAVPLVKAESPAPSETTDAAASSPSNLDRAAQRSAERVAQLQSRLASIDAARDKATTKAARDTLNAQREEIAAALALAKDVQGTVQNLARFAARGSGAGQGSGSLAAQIAQLERSVPEARRTGAKGATAAAPATSPPTPPPAPPVSQEPASQAPSGQAQRATGVMESNLLHPESAGLMALSAQLLTLRARRQELTDLMRQTDGVLKGIDDIRAPLVNSAREFMQQTDSLSSSTTAHDAAEALRTRQALQDAAGEFKQISTVIVPVAEQAIATEASRGTLAEWRDRLTAQIGTTARYMIFRAAMLGAVLVVILVLSEIWRRATFRYFHDARRRRQFLLLRRVVVTVVVSIAVMLGVVSEVGSLATYAGFVTAGIAVAMQNVILAIVAYFFLIGRSGVRVGDRITLAGVTGNVIEIGLVRIYLMELAGRDFHPTGRIVVLSNAVLFQPSALFKHVPGADYVWHVINLTVAATADAQDLETRVRAAADSVYEDYRPLIEQQNATFQRYVNIETLAPRPEVTVRLTGAGLECIVRYPAEPARAAVTDRKMIDALRDALAREPAVPLISSAGPTVE